MTGGGAGKRWNSSRAKGGTRGRGDGGRRKLAQWPGRRRSVTGNEGRAKGGTVARKEPEGEALNGGAP